MGTEHEHTDPALRDFLNQRVDEAALSSVDSEVGMGNRLLWLTVARLDKLSRCDRAHSIQILYPLNFMRQSSSRDSEV